MKKPGDSRVFFTLFKAAILFFWGLCLFSLFLYAAGTRQGFTDDTQLLILRLSRDLGLALSICSVWGGIFSSILIFRGSVPRLRLALGIGACLVLCVFGIAVSFTVSFIIAAAGGNW
jgi:hypothetical protein